MGWIKSIVIGGAMSLGFVGCLNYVLNNHASLGSFDSSDAEMSRPDILGATHYSRSMSVDGVAGGLVYVTKFGLTGKLFCRDGDFGDGPADGLCDTVCIEKPFSERVCFRRNKDYDTHRSEFEKADKMYKDTKERFAHSYF